MRNIHNRALGIAVHQHVGLGVDQHRAPHFLRPVIKMRNAPQAGFDAADDDRHIRKRFACALAVNNHRTVGPLAAFGAGRIGIVAAQPPVSGVAIDHRIHVAGRYAKKQFRFAQHLESIGALPIGLRDDANAESLCFEQPADNGHAEARMIHVRIAGHDDDVALVPAQYIHFRARHRQKWRRAETCRPILAVAENIFGAQFAKCSGRRRFGGSDV